MRYLPLRVFLLMVAFVTPACLSAEDFSWDDVDSSTNAFSKSFADKEDQRVPEESQLLTKSTGHEVSAEKGKEQPPSGDAKVAEQRVIQPGDKVLYRVIEDRDPQSNLTVSDTGELIIPYYGPVLAAGLTPGELVVKLERLLTEELYEKATVVIAVQKPAPASLLGTIFLSGRVNRIGPMQIDPHNDNTLSKIILTAGGFSDFADSSEVQIVRKIPGSEDTEVIIVDVKSVIEKGQMDKDVTVQDGDFIIVPQRLFNW